jgi:hypothetical protein
MLQRHAREKPKDAKTEPRSKQKMRRKLLMPALLVSMAATGLAYGQVGTMPVLDSRRAEDANGSHAMSAITANAAPVSESNARTGSAEGNAMAAEHKPGGNKQQKADKVKPSEQEKNPWWEPRDWTYINNSAP